jgi:hypothetical protein
MQTAPATSQKTAKVAKDDLLSALETSPILEKVSKRSCNAATSQNPTQGTDAQVPPDARPVVVN